MLSGLLGKLWGELPSSFGYYIGEKEEGEKVGYYSLYHGNKKSDGIDVTVFVCNTKQLHCKELSFVRSHLQRIKSVRHPNILRVLDSCETVQAVYIVTEVCTPLLFSEVPVELSWGFYELFSALHFLNHDCALTHGLVNPMAVFVTHSGDWRLGCFDCVCSTTQHSLSTLVDSASSHIHRGSGWNPPRGQADTPSVYIDRWGLASLICWACSCRVNENVTAGRRSASVCAVGAEGNLEFDPTMNIKFVQNQQLEDIVNELLAEEPIADLSRLLKRSFFAESKCVSVMLFLQEINLKGTHEKEMFFDQLPHLVDDLPRSSACFQVLPLLVSNLEFSRATQSAVILQSINKIGENLSTADYQQFVLPTIVKLFHSQDRAIRYALLQSMPQIDKHLDSKTINGGLFDSVILGFTDSSPQLREATMVSMIYFFPKLKQKQCELAIRALSRCLVDTEGTIRTNATIAFAKIASSMEEPNELLIKTLPDVFSRAFNDTFVINRMAGLQSVGATWHLFAPADVACRILPQICLRLADMDGAVRASSFVLMESILHPLQAKLSQPPKGEKEEALTSTNGVQVSSSTAGWLGAVAGMAKTYGKKALDFYGSRSGEAPPTGVVAATRIAEEGKVGAAGDCFHDAHENVFETFEEDSGVHTAAWDDDFDNLGSPNNLQAPPSTVVAQPSSTQTAYVSTQSPTAYVSNQATYMSSHTTASTSSAGVRTAVVSEWKLTSKSTTDYEDFFSEFGMKRAAISTASATGGSSGGSGGSSGGSSGECHVSLLSIIYGCFCLEQIEDSV
eukprot:GHVS01056426.1.p1 GENE.GHVS01056426.1~~GHVS01056426.1.p1  ORF type:complete len:791 (-),score=148.72 GHVS01056426.1:1485-3857(-)